VPSRRSHRWPAVVGLVAAFLLLGVAGGARGAVPAAYPPLPIGLDRAFLGNLSAPSLTPGQSGQVGFTVSDPMDGALVGTVLTLSIYAFNAFPGNATSTVPVAGAPILTTATTSGAYANVSLGNLAPGSRTAGAVGVATASTTPSGTFAIRSALAFTENGTAYRLESRGWFTASQWAAATELPNGSVTLNLTALGVSGVTAETAVLVTSSSLDWALYAIAGVGIVLVGVAVWLYSRRVPNSKDGAR
jgi:hypothetical protein